MKKIFALVISLVFSVSAFAYFEITSPERGVREMNGIFFDANKNFTKTWHLVTVRYRQDSREQRFTYANDIAFKAMSKMKPDYPDGAMFAKVAFITEDDPNFPSSKIPSSAKRYQFMLKNKKKYADAQGWGYALFDDKGKIFDEDVKAKTQSCVACHQIVPELDYVFSRPMLLHANSSNPVVAGADMSKVIQFKVEKLNEAPDNLKKLATPFDVYNSLIGKLRDTAFSGTLDEVIPLLSDKSKQTGAPSALLIDEDNFSLVVPKKDSKVCLEQNALLKAFHVTVRFNAKLVRDTQVCL